jgi:hypothetical protein
LSGSEIREQCETRGKRRWGDRAALGFARPFDPGCALTQVEIREHGAAPGFPVDRDGRTNPLCQARHQAISSKVLLEAALVLADVPAIFVEVTAVLVDVAVVPVDVAEILDGFADPAVGEIADELPGVFAASPLVVSELLLVLVALDLVADETAGVIEHAGVADGGDGEAARSAKA